MQGTLSPLLDGTIIAALITSTLSGVAYLYQKHNEKQAVNRAILGEISRLIDVLNRHNHFVKGLGDLSQYPLIPFSYVIYKKQVKNIGILEAGVAARVVRFYGYVDFLNALQSSKADHIRAGMGTDFANFYLHSLKNCLDTFGTAFDDNFRKAMISPPLSAPTATPAPGMPGSNPEGTNPRRQT